MATKKSALAANCIIDASALHVANTTNFVNYAQASVSKKQAKRTSEVSGPSGKRASEDSGASDKPRDASDSI